MIEKVIASGTRYIPIGEETGILSTFVREKILQKNSLNSNVEEFSEQK